MKNKIANLQEDIANPGRSLPIKHLLWFTVAVAVVLQLVIYIYLHLMGIYVIENAETFCSNITPESLVAVCMGLLLSIPDLYLILWLDKRFQWGEKTGIRTGIQLSLTVLIALVVSLFPSLLTELLVGDKENLKDVLMRNALIFTAINILLVAILEAWMFFRENRQSRQQAKTLTHELSVMRSNYRKEPSPGIRNEIFKKRFLIQIADKLKTIEVEEIAYFFAHEKNIFLRTFANKTYPAEMSLEQIEKAVDPAVFFRINRKYIVNLNAISNMVSWSKRRLKIDLNPVPDNSPDTIVSIERYTDFKRWLDR
jgi:hypothetical protein